MLKLLILMSIAITCFVKDTSGQQFQDELYRQQQKRLKLIIPTYRPPLRPYRPIIRTVRKITNQPLWLYKDVGVKAPSTGEHFNLLQGIDDIHMDPNRRYARSVDSPSAKRHLRNIPRRPYAPVRPRPRPFNQRPNPRPLRLARDVRSGFHKPPHHTIVIPNWNPNARTKPYQIIKVKTN